MTNDRTVGMSWLPLLVVGLLLLYFALTQACASTITISAQDSGLGGPPVTIATSNGTPILGLQTFFPNGLSGGVVSALITGNTYEFAANDVSNTVPDTLNLFATFKGIVAPSGKLTLPSFMETDEYAAPGWTISQQVFVAGKLVGSNTDTSLSAITPTFMAIAGLPYTIELELQFVSDGITAGDYGAAVVTTPTAMVPIPAPVIGAGIPGGLVTLVVLGLGVLIRPAQAYDVYPRYDDYPLQRLQRQQRQIEEEQWRQDQRQKQLEFDLWKERQEEEAERNRQYDPLRPW